MPVFYDEGMRQLAAGVADECFERAEDKLKMGKHLERMFPWLKGRYVQYRRVNHTFITLAFPQEALEECQNIHRKLETLSYADLNEYAYIYEFYGDKGKPNFHVHMLVRGKLNKKNYIRNFSRKFKLPPSKVDIRLGDEEEVFDKRCNYLKGIKQDKKLDACCMNEEERKKRDLDALYDRNLFSNLHI